MLLVQSVLGHVSGEYLAKRTSVDSQDIGRRNEKPHRSALPFQVSSFVLETPTRPNIRFQTFNSSLLTLQLSKEAIFLPIYYSRGLSSNCQRLNCARLVSWKSKHKRTKRFIRWCQQRIRGCAPTLRGYVDAETLTCRCLTFSDNKPNKHSCGDTGRY